MAIEIDLSDILIVDDSVAQAKTAEEYLKAAGHMVRVANSLNESEQLIGERMPDLMLLDVQLPDGDGIEYLPNFRAKYPDLAVVVITAFGTVDRAVTSVQNGASDFLEKPVNSDRLITTVNNALEKRKLRQIVDNIAQIETKDRFHDFIGSSLAMQGVYKIIEAAAPSTASVFITGESGTGKELAASATHQASARKDAPFVALNCAAIPKELIESEIFGHIKGAFTGATHNRDGAATQADGGTLFLDEICEMDIDLQAKLLRFLQTGTIQRVGASKTESVDVRFVCATNKNPWEEVQDGRFREDLYYRLHVIPLHLPPLRDRDDDVLTIGQFLLDKMAQEEKKNLSGFNDDVQAIFRRYRWPGNVRELQNVVRNIVVLHDGELIEPAHLPYPINQAIGLANEPTVSSNEETPAANGAAAAPRGNTIANMSYLRPMEEIEMEIVKLTLNHFDGNSTKAAKSLDINPSTLYRKLKKWGISIDG